MTFMDRNSCLMCCLLLSAGANAAAVVAIAVPGLVLVLAGVVHGEATRRGQR